VEAQARCQTRAEPVEEYPTRSAESLLRRLLRGYRAKKEI